MMDAVVPLVEGELYRVSCRFVASGSPDARFATKARIRDSLWTTALPLTLAAGNRATGNPGSWFTVIACVDPGEAEKLLRDLRRCGVEGRTERVDPKEVEQFLLRVERTVNARKKRRGKPQASAPPSTEPVPVEADVQLDPSALPDRVSPVEVFFGVGFLLVVLLFVVVFF
ncbi:MAG: hypothetical protein HQL59_09235 [Magnetococcales bacterium]|nr:hypothetical protein [Magnetococcales bacterium]